MMQLQSSPGLQGAEHPQLQAAVCTQDLLQHEEQSLLSSTVRE